MSLEDRKPGKLDNQGSENSTSIRLQIFNLYAGLDFALIIVGLASIYVIFHKLFESIITTYLVITIFQFVETGIVTDLAWYTLFVLSLSASISRKRIRPPQSLKLTMVMLVLSVGYIVYRVESVWIFHELETLSFLNYADLLPIYTSVSVLSWLVYFSELKRIPNQNSPSGFYEDLPINNLEEDTYNLQYYVNQLSRRIKSTFPRRSFCIGINGSWGSGKTSFLNFLKNDLKGSAKVIEFNPWESKSHNYISEDFFEIFREEIEIINKPLGRLIGEYSEKISSVENVGVIRATLDLLVPGNESKSRALLHQEIGQVLKANNQKIIVLIDDLDRLDNSEILEVVKLVRNAANFPNTFFLLAYDRLYIDSQLKDMGHELSNKYLEKIIQLEITLPIKYSNQLRNELFNLTKSIFEDSLITGQESVKHHITSWEEAVKGARVYKIRHLDRWLVNLRDVKRLANSIQLNLPNLIGEVNLYDFLKLELLKLKYPIIYSLLLDDHLSILALSHSNYSSKKYVLNNSSNPEDSSVSGSNHPKATQAFEKLDSMNIYSSAEIKEIIEFLKELFPSDKRSFMRPDINNLACNIPRNFHVYFRYSLSSKDFSLLEYKSLRDDGLDSFKKGLKSWLTNGHQERIQELLEDELNLSGKLKNRFEFERLIEDVFAYASHQKPNAKSNDDPVGFDESKIFLQFTKARNGVLEKFYNGDLKKFTTFLVHLLSMESSSLIFLSELCFKWRSYHDSYSSNEGLEPIISQDDLERFNLLYFQKRLDDTYADQVDLNLFYLFNWCIKSSSINKENPVKADISGNASEKFLEYAYQTGIGEFLIWLIQKDQMLNAKNSNLFHLNLAMIKKLFDSPDHFIDYLDSLTATDWEHIVEYRDFCKKAHKTTANEEERLNHKFTNQFLEAFYNRI